MPKEAKSTCKIVRLQDYNYVDRLCPPKTSGATSIFPITFRSTSVLGGIRITTSVNRMNFEDDGWDEDGGSYSDNSDPDLDGLNLMEKDDVLVIGIDFGTTYVPNFPLQSV